MGSSVEAAREDAINKLNAGLEEDVKFDIIAIQKKKILGIFGGGDAKVRAYVEGPDEAPKKSPAKNDRPSHNKNSAQRTEHKQAVKPEKPANNVKPAKPAEKTEVSEKTEEPAGIPAEQLDPASQAGRAYAYLAAVLEKLGCSDITATVQDVEGGSKITLAGNDKLGVIIGRRGETLDALQYLASLVANEKGSGYYRVVIDIGNYREKRENTLEALAKRTAGQVLRTGRSRSLEPMNPYERRVIHTAIQGIEGVVSTSIGDGAGRRVVISPEGKTPRVQGGRGGKGAGRGGNRNGSRPVKSAETDAVQKPKETDGTKLYGRLDK